MKATRPCATPAHAAGAVGFRAQVNLLRAQGWLGAWSTPPSVGYRYRCVLAPHMRVVRSIRVGRKISPAAQGCWAHASKEGPP